MTMKFAVSTIPLILFLGIISISLLRCVILHSRVFLFNKPDVVDDRISQLPDDILFSVISRLSIIDALNFFKKIPFFKYYPDSKRAFYPVPTTFNREEFVEAVDTFFQHFSGSKLVSFSFPKLTFLRIELWIHTQVGEIELNRINLNSFEYIECERRRLTFTSVPSLERLSITLYDNRVGPSVFRQLIEDLPPVKSLLSLYSLALSFILMRAKPESVLNITTILDACPLLQKFHLVLQTTESALFFGQKIEMSLEPHSQLEEVELSGFSGTWIEIVFSLYILKNVVTLKRMRMIRCPKRYVGYGRWDWMENVETRFSEKQRRRIHERLQGQALSKSAQVIIRG
ncbi:hypothetical protein ACJIZ3_021782 [Penstemon smallii]|uniref:F-box domain-containing protein n=1 Tax=Penstemon smallii TaxID=265156 RepID=A0ABD3SN40_9LAMI